VEVLDDNAHSFVRGFAIQMKDLENANRSEKNGGRDQVCCDSSRV
jgi:hypothetical protein